MKNWSPAKQFNQKLILDYLAEVNTRVNSQLKNLNRIEELEFTAWRGSDERDQDYEMALIKKELKAELYRMQIKMEYKILVEVKKKIEDILKANPSAGGRISAEFKREIISFAYICIRKSRDECEMNEDENLDHLLKGLNFDKIESNVISRIKECDSPETLIDSEKYELPIQLQYLRETRKRLSLEHCLFDLYSSDESTALCSNYFYGKHIAEHNISAGQCGEFTALSLYLLIKEYRPKFYQQRHENDETYFIIEEIIVTYDDDNHVFVAINRNPQSDIDDFSTWGDDAIIFDAWNHLITYACDYTPRNFKHCFESYHIEGKWSAVDGYVSREVSHDTHDDSVKLEKDTREILKIKDDNDYLRRIEMQCVIAEISVEKYPDLYRIILGFVDELKPRNFNTPLHFYYTEIGNVPVAAKQFCNRIAIIFNHQFLKSLAANRIFDLNDFKFALASELELIYSFSGKLNATLPLNVTQHIDCKAGQVIGVPTYGLKYLKKCQDFITYYDFINVRFSYRDIDVSADNNLTEDGLNKRLQTLRTHFAAESGNGESMALIPSIQTQAIPFTFVVEISELPVIPSAYTIDLKPYGSFGKKISYLITQLHYLESDTCARELDIRDIPHTVSRLLEVVASLAPNLDDPVTQSHISRFLRHIQLNHHVYYEHFYVAIFGRGKVHHTPNLLPAYAHFKLFAKLLVNFLQAETRLIAEKQENEIAEYFVKYAHFYNQERWVAVVKARKYVAQFKSEHGRLPIDQERAFFSTLGYRIIKNSIIDIDNVEHILSLIPDRSIDSLDDHLIAKTLWTLGVNVNFKFWDKFSTSGLSKLFMQDDDEESVPVRIHLPGKLGLMSYKHFHAEFNIILAMYFVENRKFEAPKTANLVERFHQYYQAAQAWFILDMMSDYKFEVDKDGIEKNYGLSKEQIEKLASLKNKSKEVIEGFIEIIEALFCSKNANEQKIAIDFLFGDGAHSLSELRKFSNKSSHYPLMSSNLFFRYIVEKIKANVSPLLVEEVREIFKVKTKSPLKNIMFSAIDLPDYYVLFQIEDNGTLENFLLVLTQVLESFESPYSNKMTAVFELIIKFCEKNRIKGYTPDAIKVFNFIKEKVKIYPIDYSLIAKLISYLGVEHRVSIRDYFSWWHKPETVLLKDIIDRFHAYDFFMLFDCPELRSRMLKSIVDRIKSLTDVKDIMQAVEQLILDNDSPFSQPINDIDVFNECLLLWGRALKTHYGMDDGTDDYYNAIKPKITYLRQNVFKSDSRQIFIAFCEAILAQNKISWRIGQYEGYENPLAVSDQNKSLKGATLSVLSVVMQFLSERKDNIDMILDFLCKPLCNESIYAFTDHIINTDQDITFLKKYGQNTHGYDNADKRSKRAQIAMTVKKMYFQFWSSSITHRATVINYLLIPSSMYADEALYTQAYLDAFDIIINRLFTIKPYSEEDEFAIALLKAYLNASNLYERSYILCAMIVAQQANALKAATTVDKLITLCEHLGPAYIKFLQAVHSYPKTPERFKSKLAHAKGKAAMPTRWDLFDLISVALPKQELNNIGHVGMILGCASFNIAVEVTYRNKPVVLSMLRLNGRQQARKGFKLLNETLEICDHSLMDKHRHDAKVMIRDAETMSEIETNFEVGDQQYAIAQSIYGSLPTRQVVINNENYKLEVKPCRNISSGHDYRLLTVAPGCEFNALSVDTPQDQQIKHAIAVAIVEIELLNLMRGNQFDCDRHGCQYRVLVDHTKKLISVGLFDFGLMSVSKPSHDDISHLGELVLYLLTHLAANSINDRVEQFIQDKLNKNLDTSYLRSLRKAFLAMSDFLSLLNFHDYIQLSRKILSHPELHPMLRPVCQIAKSSLIVNVAMMADSLAPHATLWRKHELAEESEPTGASFCCLSRGDSKGD